MCAFRQQIFQQVLPSDQDDDDDVDSYICITHAPGSKISIRLSDPRLQLVEKLLDHAAAADGTTITLRPDLPTPPNAIIASCPSFVATFLQDERVELPCEVAVVVRPHHVARSPAPVVDEDDEDAGQRPVRPGRSDVVVAYEPAPAVRQPQVPMKRWEAPAAARHHHPEPAPVVGADPKVPLGSSVRVVPASFRHSQFSQAARDIDKGDPGTAYRSIRMGPSANAAPAPEVDPRDVFVPSASSLGRPSAHGATSAAASALYGSTSGLPAPSAASSVLFGGTTARQPPPASASVLYGGGTTARQPAPAPAPAAPSSMLYGSQPAGATASSSALFGSQLDPSAAASRSSMLYGSQHSAAAAAAAAPPPVHSGAGIFGTPTSTQPPMADSLHRTAHHHQPAPAPAPMFSSLHSSVSSSSSSSSAGSAFGEPRQPPVRALFLTRDEHEAVDSKDLGPFLSFVFGDAAVGPMRSSESPRLRALCLELRQGDVPDTIFHRRLEMLKCRYPSLSAVLEVSPYRLVVMRKDVDPRVVRAELQSWVSFQRVQFDVVVRRNQGDADGTEFDLVVRCETVGEFEALVQLLATLEGRRDYVLADQTRLTFFDFEAPFSLDGVSPDVPVSRIREALRTSFGDESGIRSVINCGDGTALVQIRSRRLWDAISAQRAVRIRGGDDHEDLVCPIITPPIRKLYLLCKYEKELRPIQQVGDMVLKPSEDEPTRFVDAEFVGQSRRRVVMTVRADSDAEFEQILRIVLENVTDTEYRKFLPPFPDSFQPDWYAEDHLKSLVMSSWEHDHPVFRSKFVPKVWLDFLEVHQADPELMRRMLKMVFVTTIGQLMHGRVPALEKPLVPLRTLRFSDDPCKAAPTTLQPATQIELSHESLLRVAGRVMENGTNHVMVVYPACENAAQGEHLGSDRSEMDELLRRSNYVMAVNPSLVVKSGAEGVFNPQPKVLGCCFTPSVTVFRDSAERGYRPSAAYNVSVATVHPVNCQGGDLTDNEELAVRSRLETVLSAALEEPSLSIDCVVIGSWVCGGPSRRMAEICRAVALEYNQCFKLLCFAIEDKETRDVFQEVFRDFEPNCAPLLPRAQRIHAGISTCPDMGECEIAFTQPAHAKECYHPPFCPYEDKCPHDPDASPYHFKAFRHREVCQEGCECHLWVENPDHLKLMRHEFEVCPKGVGCKRYRDDDHMRQYLHYPTCRHFGKTQGLHKKCKGCHLLDRPAIAANHRATTWHVPTECRHGTFCPDFWNPQHMHRFWHPHDELDVCNCVLRCPFLKRCKEGDPDCQSHEDDFSHACMAAETCTQTDDPSHTRKYYHIQRPPCPNPGCLDNDLPKMPLYEIEAHLENFDHTSHGIRGFRNVCPHGMQCDLREKRDMAHMCRFFHVEHLHWSKLAIPIDHNLNRGDPVLGNRPVDFAANAKNTIRDIAQYTQVPVPAPIMDFACRIKPTHKCNTGVFKSMVTHNCLVSLFDLVALPQAVQVQCSNFVQGSKGPLMSKLAGSFQRQDSLYNEEFVKNYLFWTFTKEFETAHPTGRSMVVVDRNLRRSRANLRGLTQALHDVTVQNAQRIVAAAEGIAQQGFGIGYQPDVEFGTNLTVFSMLGPNTGHYGQTPGGPPDEAICLVLNPLVMYHPSFSMTCGAATSYRNNFARTEKCEWRRATLPAGAKIPTQPQEKGPVECHVKFNEAKTNLAFPEAVESVAVELAAKIQKMNGDYATAPTKDQLWKLYAGKGGGHKNHHNWFLGYMPSGIPLQYIDHIIGTPRRIQAGIGVDVLGELEERFGKDRLKKTLVEANVNDEMKKEDHILASCPAERMFKGLCFGLCHFSLEQFLPMRLGPGVSHVYFEVIGRRWALFMGDQDLTPENVAPAMPGRKMLGVFFGTEENEGEHEFNSHFLYWANLGQPSDSVRSPVLPRTTRFNWGVNERQFVSYHLRLDLAKGEFLLEHWTPSVLLNDRKLEVTNKDIVGAHLKFISLMAFGAEQDKVFVRNFRVYDEQQNAKYEKTSKAQFLPLRTKTVRTGKERRLAAVDRARGSPSRRRIPIRRRGGDRDRDAPSVDRSFELPRARIGAEDAEIPSVAQPESPMFEIRRERIRSEHDAPPRRAPRRHAHHARRRVPGDGAVIREDASHSPSTRGVRVLPEAPRDDHPPRRSGKPLCRLGNCCERFRDAAHMAAEEHPYKRLCAHLEDCPEFLAFDPRRDQLTAHLRDFTHVCKFGAVCRCINRSKCRHNIHVSMPRCQLDKRCQNMTYEHRRNFSHSGLPLILVPCRHHPDCRDWKKWLETKDTPTPDRKAKHHVWMFGHVHEGAAGQ